MAFNLRSVLSVMPSSLGVIHHFRIPVWARVIPKNARQRNVVAHKTTIRRFRKRRDPAYITSTGSARRASCSAANMLALTTFLKDSQPIPRRAGENISVCGCRANQCIAATAKMAPAMQDKHPDSNTLRLLRNNQRVEGTMTSTPSHAICLAVPPTAFNSAAEPIHAMAE